MEVTVCNICGKRMKSDHFEGHFCVATTKQVEAMAKSAFKETGMPLKGVTEKYGFKYMATFDGEFFTYLKVDVILMYNQISRPVSC